MRKPIVAGNWKMNKTRAEAAALIAGIKTEIANLDAVEIVVGVPFTDLDVAGQARVPHRRVDVAPLVVPLGSSPVQLGDGCGVVGRA